MKEKTLGLFRAIVLNPSGLKAPFTGLKAPVHNFSELSDTQFKKQIDILQCLPSYTEAGQ